MLESVSHMCLIFRNPGKLQDSCRCVYVTCLLYYTILLCLAASHCQVHRAGGRTTTTHKTKQNSWTRRGQQKTRGLMFPLEWDLEWDCAKGGKNGRRKELTMAGGGGDSTRRFLPFGLLGSSASCHTAISLCCTGSALRWPLSCRRGAGGGVGGAALSASATADGGN